ncbi:hypothetical protein Tco_0001475 [Tanacetum coccineum]
MASDDIEQTINDVANDADQPPDDPPQTKDKDPKKDWFKQPPMPLTLDLEWNKHQLVVDQPKQPWFNQMVYAAKDPLTFDELMATLIDFSKYAMNRLKIDNLTQAHLVGSVYELLKGTCISSIKLEYNMEECFKALANKLDWDNPEGDCRSFDLTNPIPLKGIKDMVPMLWSATKVGYGKDVLKGIKHWGNKRQLCVKVKRLHGYGHLDEIVVKRADRQLYKFKEVTLLTLLWPFVCSQEVLSSKDMSRIYQLGVESYQNKLNITEPQKTFPRIEFKELYTLSYKPPGDSYSGPVLRLHRDKTAEEKAADIERFEAVNDEVIIFIDRYLMLLTMFPSVRVIWKQQLLVNHHAHRYDYDCICCESTNNNRQQALNCLGHCGHIDLVSPVYNPLLFDMLYNKHVKDFGHLSNI